MASQGGFQPEKQDDNTFWQGGFNSTTTQDTFSQGGFQSDNDIPPPHPKRIVVCCDGTWQSSVSGVKNVPSNITRLARAVARSGKDTKDKVWDQVVYYDAGLGTGVFSIAEKLKQGDLGMGFVGNVIEAYNFIVLNYSPGDQIFCFGFSRGAYTARAVAGLVNDIGVLSPRDMQDFPELFTIYQKNTNSHGFRKSKEYREWVTGTLSKDQPPKVEGGFQEPPRYDKPPHREAPEASRVVEVVGVFDTVGSLGVPDTPSDVLDFGLQTISKLLGVPKVGFHNVSLSPYIRHAFQALALEEHRGPFTPTLWHVPVPGDKTTNKPSKPEDSLETLQKQWVEALNNGSDDDKDKAWAALVNYEMFYHLEKLNSDLLQVWFPGVHVNIGGGSKDLLEDKKGDFEQISTITFAWMCEQIAPYLQLVPNLAEAAVTDRMTLIRPVLKEVAELQEAKAKESSHWAITRAWEYFAGCDHKKDEPNTGDVISMAYRGSNGWATGPIVDSFKGIMKYMGSVTRTPGQYRKDSEGNDKGITNEHIHPCVRFRQIKKGGELPPSLAGFERKPLEDGKGYQWSKGDVDVPEYLITPKDKFTRYVAGLDDSPGGLTASEFLGEIDRLVGQLGTPESKLFPAKSGQ